MDGNDETKLVLQSFVDIDLICTSSAALENSFISLKNSKFEENNLSKVFIEEDYIEQQIKEKSANQISAHKQNQASSQNVQVLKDRIMHQLNNIRFRFNGNMIIPNYPEVEFPKDKSKQLLDTQLISYEKKIMDKALFDTLFSEIIWVSYRRGFSPLHKKDSKKQGRVSSFFDMNTKKFSSDCGWGCMIRCQQMMLANIFQKMSEEGLLKLSRMQIIRKVMDHKNEPFSIHQIIQQGQKLLGKEPGDWYGVNSITQVIQKLFEEYQQNDHGYDELFEKLDFLAVQDGSIFQKVIHQKILKGYEKQSNLRKKQTEQQKNTRVS